MRRLHVFKNVPSLLSELYNRSRSRTDNIAGCKCRGAFPALSFVLHNLHIDPPPPSDTSGQCFPLTSSCCCPSAGVRRDFSNCTGILGATSLLRYLPTCSRGCPPWKECEHDLQATLSTSVTERLHSFTGSFCSDSGKQSTTFFRRVQLIVDVKHSRQMRRRALRWGYEVWDHRFLPDGPCLRRGYARFSYDAVRVYP